MILLLIFLSLSPFMVFHAIIEWPLAANQWRKFNEGPRT